MKIAEPNLNGYSYYPELFVVPSDFCSKKWGNFLSNKNVRDSIIEQKQLLFKVQN